MADPDFSSVPNSSGVPKPQVYDLLNRLNAAFARVVVPKMHSPRCNLWFVESAGLCCLGSPFQPAVEFP